MDVPKKYLDRLMKRARPLNITSERQELVQHFVDRINAERGGTRWKPTTWRQINGLVRFLKERDLYWFFGECERGERFGKTFFGILKRARQSCRSNRRGGKRR